MTRTGRLEETRRAVDRDATRVEQRRPSGFLRALALVGSVGWPIALLSAGGAVLGRLLDQWLGTGVLVTVALLVAGAVAGSLMAVRTLREHGGGP